MKQSHFWILMIIFVILRLGYSNFFFLGVFDGGSNL